MLRKTWQCLIGLALTVMVSAAAAQEPYLVGSVGQSYWNFDCGTNGCDRSTTAWRAGAGIRFNRIVAAEAFYYDFGRARSSDFSLDGKLRGTAVGLQALVGWMTTSYEVAGKLGLASVRSDFKPSPTSFDIAETNRHNELIGGLMFGYRFTKNLGVRLDVDLVTVALDSNGVFYSRGSDVTSAVLGLSLHF
jgi:hypothetical protein